MLPRCFAPVLRRLFDLLRLNSTGTQGRTCHTRALPPPPRLSEVLCVPRVWSPDPATTRPRDHQPKRRWCAEAMMISETIVQRQPRPRHQYTPTAQCQTSRYTALPGGYICGFLPFFFAFFDDFHLRKLPRRRTELLLRLFLKDRLLYLFFISF